MVDQNHDEPMFVISVAARLLEVHPQTLRYYERAGLLKPTRSSGKIRLYSQREIDRLRKIQRLTTELGVNLAGAEIIIDLTERLEKLQDQMNRREAELIVEIQQLQDKIGELRAKSIR
jgi:MerR family transcriptional regulator/heat shock protein HspR